MDKAVVELFHVGKHGRQDGGVHNDPTIDVATATVATATNATSTANAIVVLDIASIIVSTDIVVIVVVAIAIAAAQCLIAGCFLLLFLFSVIRCCVVSPSATSPSPPLTLKVDCCFLTRLTGTSICCPPHLWQRQHLPRVLCPLLSSWSPSCCHRLSKLMILEANFLQDHGDPTGLER